MRRLLIVLAILTGYAHATVRFLNGAATGSANGSTWANAWTTTTQMNAASSGFGAGDIVCMAGGTYGGQGIVTNAGGSSGNPIIYKRATAADANCGSTTTGWSSGFDSTVIISGGGLIQNSNITISGNGVAGGISMPVANASGGPQMGVDAATTNITMTYMEFGQTGCGSSGCNQNADTTAISMNHFNGSTYDLQTNWLIDHVNMHGECTTMQMASSSNLIIQYSRFADSIDLTPGNPNCHPNSIFYSGGATTNITFRYNEVVNNQVEGILSDATATWDVYGNIIHDPYVVGGNVSRFFEAQNSTVTVHEYNNTFVGYSFLVNNTANSGVIGSGSVSNNNIFVNSVTPGLPANDFDAFNGSTGGETHGQNIATSIFVNFSAGTVAGYALASDTAAGTTLSAPFNVDINGTVRGVNGTWDRGYFQIPSTSNTWHILLTGGNPTQCTGLVNAAYPGSGSGQPCAFSHPFWLVRSDGTTMVQPGDTVQFDDLGPYLMGQQMDGLGFDWSSLQPALNCVGGNVENRDCHMPNDSSIFNGTDNTHKTRFLGKNAGACTIGNSTTTGNETVLMGINHINWVWSFDNGQFQDMECIAMTGHDKCQQVGIGPKTITNTAASGGIATYTFTDPGDPHLAVNESVTVTGTTNGSGVFNITGNIITLTGTTFTLALTGTVASHSDTGTAVFANGCQNGPGHAGLENWASNGILFGLNTDQGPSNVVLNNLHLYGIVNSAILGSHFNRTSGDVMTITNLNMDGDGQEGFNADDGNGGTANEAVGTMNFSNWDVEWIGFLEISPGVFNFGVDQGFLGNGDCIVMVASGGTWNWSNINIRFCAQDGFDGLHLRDDLTVNPVVNINQMQSRQIEGQTIKIGAKTAVITNSIANSDSNWPFDDSFPSNPLGWNSLIGLTFRANDGITAAIGDGSDITFQNVTNITNQNVWWDFSPGVSGNCTTSTSCRMSFQNNASFGYTNPSSPIFIGTTFDPLGNPASLATNNSWWHIGGGGVCPGNSHESAQVCTNPQFTQQVTMYSPDFNPLPLSSSPLKAAGVHLTGVPTDFNGATRLNPPTIGAIEAAGGSVTLTSITVLPNPGSVVTSSTVNFQTSSFCTFSDSSTVAAGSTGCVVAWSTTGAHSTINSSTGVATGVSAGSDTITATLSPATPATATLNVTAPSSGSTIIMGITLNGVTIK